VREKVTNLITAGPAAEELLRKLNLAVSALNAARDEHTSRATIVGGLLLEAKGLHPQVKDFEAFLRRIDGLHRSRAYELLKLAAGRTTEPELQRQNRARQRRHRKEKRKAVAAAQAVAAEQAAGARAEADRATKIRVEADRAEAKRYAEGLEARRKAAPDLSVTSRKTDDAAADDAGEVFDRLVTDLLELKQLDLEALVRSKSSWDRVLEASRFLAAISKLKAAEAKDAA
jgi:hypothetical protein